MAVTHFFVHEIFVRSASGTVASFGRASIGARLCSRTQFYRYGVALFDMQRPTPTAPSLILCLYAPAFVETFDTLGFERQKLLPLQV